MYLDVQEKNPAFLYGTPLLHQSSFWSQVKQTQGYEIKAFDIKTRYAELKGGLSSAYLLDDVMVQMVPIDREHSIGYIPYGPSLAPTEDAMGSFLEELSLTLNPLLPDSCVMLRYDLPWKRVWEENDIDEQLQNVRLNWGTQTKALRKAPSDQLPCDTMIVDISGSEEEILRRMRQKTRYNILLAQRKGVEVRLEGLGQVEIFYELYRQTCLRNHITLHDLSYFTSLYEAEDENAGIALLIAYHDGLPVSAMFLSRSALRATYLFGASSSDKRNTMSTYLLQWHAMKLAKLWGCVEYDMFGVAPSTMQAHPMQGLSRFKKGFGGNLKHLMGCWDYCFDQEVTDILFAHEMVDLGYHRR